MVDEPQTDSPKPADSGQASSKSVLIVEDDPVLLKMYSEKFTYEGYSVLNARDGEEALKVLEEGNVAVILLDIMLPRLSGTEFLKKLRATSKGKGTPVVALTNLAEEEEKKKAEELGVKDYLVKAMQTPEKVVDTVKKYLS